jgi:hypothetical protein
MMREEGAHFLSFPRSGVGTFVFHALRGLFRNHGSAGEGANAERPEEVPPR